MSPVWEDAETSVASVRCRALDGSGVIHGFAVRQQDIPVKVGREEALRQLFPRHEFWRHELGLAPRSLCTAEQVHGAGVALANPDLRSPHRNVDALISDDPRVCLGIYTADCCAVYLVDPRRRAIGLVHAGAKGAKLGIVPETLAAMHRHFGSDPVDVAALLSPCIRPPLYEFDFAGLVREQLLAAGVRNISDPGVCTGKQVDRYYSYRMEKGATGRMLALLALNG